MRVAALFCALALAAAPLTFAAEGAATSLFPDTINLPVVDGSSVPEECHFPADLTDTAKYEPVCVTMQRENGGAIGAAYLGLLGQRGWRQGPYSERGISAVRPAGDDCEERLDIFPSDYPPEASQSPEVVIWFVREKQPRCGDQRLAP